MSPERPAPGDRLRSSAVDSRAPAVHSLAAPGEPRERGELLALADLTLAEYLRYLAAYGGAILEEDGLLLFGGPHRQPNPYRNGALRLTNALSIEDVLGRAGRFFGARKSGYALWSREHGDADLEAAAERTGLQRLERLPELLMEELPPYLPPADGVEIRPAADQRTREHYLALVADAWGMGAMPLEVAAKVFFDPDSLADPRVAAFVAYYDGLPLSAAMTLVTHDVALACQGATIRRPKPGQKLPRPGPPGAHRSLAQSCLWAALEHSYKHLGARCSLGQTSSLGAPVWLDLGYRTITNYARYRMPVPQAGGASGRP